ncbi:serine hydrolase [Virgibacillus ihumii]|uniref:serine hydrolase n=1 Tax=Virgibacillus ihumii TaxID=2686091 RepID=UPI001C2D3A48|nr:serine hydrolase [Virgibacillus ihumii]
MKKFCFSTIILVLVFFMLTSPAYANNGQSKLSHGSPQSVNMDKKTLQEIDDIVEEAISNQITPGAVVLIAKENKIVKESAYGFAKKYDMGTLFKNPVKMTKKTIFDLASITKVMGTTQGIMKLVSEGKLSVEDKVSEYILEFAKNGKGHITIEDLLTHTSGLTPWEPTYLYADNPEEVLDYINNLSLEYETGTDRRYSDFSFMTLGFVIEKISGKKLDEYLQMNVYEPLKMKDTMFNAAENTNKRIAATSFGNAYEYKMIDDPNFGYYVEEDPDMFNGWRNYTLQGEVNDGNSYYANNGVAGHAGLFSTARDLAVLAQTMLNNGNYGKVDLYDKEVIEKFTSEQRFGQGYGWEKNKEWYMGNRHSEQAYGHTGFTGTQIIIDPKYNLQIIVLTNKQNNGPLESGYLPSTGPLSQEIVNTVYESISK